MGQGAQGAAAAERAADHARRAASRREEAWALGQYAYCLLDGPAPVEEGVRWLQQVLRGVAGNPVIEANLSGFLAAHEAMGGHFERARERMAPSKALTASLGLKWQVAVHDYLLSARIEALAGDPAAAEREMRAAYDIFCEIGDMWLLADVAVDLPRTVYDQGRHDDAFALVEAADQLPAPTEIAWHVKRRDMRARVLAQRGQFDEAEALARQAVELAARTDHLEFHGDALMGLAEVLHLADRAEEALAPVEEALRLYARKGNLVLAGMARGELAKLRQLGRSATPTGARSRGAARRREHGG
jgi:tetratricopeptide (TPR) repeat protein